MIIFRKNALNKISSAEELDKAIIIVNSKSWLAIVVISVIFAIFVSWSIFARIGSTVVAPGIFLPNDGIIVDIVSSNPGTLERIYVSVGDIIEKDGLVAELSAASDLRKLQNAQDKLASEVNLYNNIERNINTRAQKLDKIRQEQLERIDSQIEFLQSEVKNNKDILDKRVIAYEQKNITQAALTNARSNYLRSRQQLDTLLSNKEDKLFNAIRSRQQDEEQLEKIQQTIQSLKNSVVELEQSIKETKIYSPIAGRIIELKHIPGATIPPNETLSKLVSSQSQYYARAEKNLEFIAYINVASGKKINVGTQVNIAVDGFDKNSYGFVKGVVVDISSFPVSNAGILSKLGNRNLVNQFTQQGSVYEVIVRLLHDSESNNRLLWSTENGQQVDNVEIGTLGNAEFILEEERPINRAIPALEQLLF